MGGTWRVRRPRGGTVDRSRPVRQPSLANRVLAALAFLLSAGCAVMGVATGVATAERPPDPCPPSAASWHPDPTPMRAADPVELTVDRIDACSSLVPVGAGEEVDGQLRVAAPSVHAPEHAGWFRPGPAPERAAPPCSSAASTATGAAASSPASRTRPRATGSPCGAATASTAVFTVTGTVQVSPVKFPAREVHADTGDAELRLIAYGGAAAGDDLIVYARLTGQG